MLGMGSNLSCGLLSDTITRVCAGFFSQKYTVAKQVVAHQGRMYIDGLWLQHVAQACILNHYLPIQDVWACTGFLIILSYDSAHQVLFTLQ